MDQLTAYKILQLKPGSGRKEIREAYARLAKEYHPEEYPKEFNEIQEAYQTLTGRGDGRRQGFSEETSWERTKADSEKTFWEEKSDTDMTEEEDTKEDCQSEEQDSFTEKERDIQQWEFRFDTFEEEDRRCQTEREREAEKRRADWQREQQKLEEQIRQAVQDSLYELETILADKKRRNRVELYEPFFFRRENKAVMRQEGYVSGLIALLEKYPVKKKVYLALKKIYSGTGGEPTKILLRYLEQKIGKGSPAPWGAAAFVSIGMCQLQFCCSEEWSKSLMTMALLTVLIFGLGILYAVLRMHYSMGISQIWIAGILFWLTLLSVITTVSDTMFSEADVGIGFAVLVWMESVLWMAILGIRAVILKIAGKVKTKGQ